MILAKFSSCMLIPSL